MYPTPESQTPASLDGTFLVSRVDKKEHKDIPMGKFSKLQSKENKSENTQWFEKNTDRIGINPQW